MALKALLKASRRPRDTLHTRLQQPAAGQWFAHPYLIRGKQLLASR
jgi:hypothetical protein